MKLLRITDEKTELKLLRRVSLIFIFAIIFAVATIVSKYDIFQISTSVSINLCLYFFDAAFSLILLVAFMSDRHKINRLSTCFYMLLLSHLIVIVPYFVETIYTGIGGREAQLTLIVPIENIAELLFLLTCINFVSEGLGVRFWNDDLFALPTQVCMFLYLLCVFGSYWMPQLIWLTYLAWWFIAAFLVIFILQNTRDLFEIISLVSLNVVGTVVEIVGLLSDSLLVSPFGDFVGILLCFDSIYIAGSNSLSDKEKDLDLARAVQESMLPKEFSIPEFENIELYATTRSAKEVGGDFYDFYKISRKHIAFVVADVDGKGASGAMMMMRAITAIKNFARAGLSVDKLMEMASRNINEHNDEKVFVTAWMGMLNVENGKLRYVNAGHNHPLIRHADGNIEELKSETDSVMGSAPDTKYNKQVMFLQPGDSLVLFTSGFAAAIDEKKESLDMEELYKVLQNNAFSSKELCEHALGFVDRFVGDAEQFDDMTLFSLKYAGPNEHLSGSGLSSLFKSELQVSNQTIRSGDLSGERFDKISFVEETADESAIEIEVINTEVSFADYAAKSQHMSYKELEKSGFGIKDTAIPLSGINEEVASPLPIEIIEEVASPLPIEIEEIASPLPIEIIEEVASPLPIEIEEVASPLPIEIEEIAAPLPIEIEEIAAPLPIEIEEIAAPLPIEIEEASAVYVETPLSQEKKPVKINRLADDYKEFAALAILGNVDYMTELMDSFLTEVECPLDIRLKLDIAFDEIFSNIARYAYKNQEGNCKVKIRKILDPLGVILSVVDKGLPYNPLEKTDPDPERGLESRSNGGAGIFIVKQYMDDVIYENADGENRLTMIKLF